MYQKIVKSYGNIIVLEQNGVRLSFMENAENIDYQKYLEWIGAGNEPEIIEE